jgi:hypothetical protein
MRQWVTHTSASANIRSLERRAKAKKNQRECLATMMRLLVRDKAQNTKNPTIAVLPPTATMAGMEVANIVLNYLVGVHSSQVTSTNYVT